MRRSPLTARRAIFTIIATFVASLVVSVSGAAAIVVNDNGTVAGVSLLPSFRAQPLPVGVSAVAAAPNVCTDPFLSPDLGGPAVNPLDGLNGLCYRGGSVVHKNEVFALTWDQHRSYWSTTRGYVEQFLRDVADSSGSLNSPYALTTQYNDGGGRAANASSFGGGCIDYGAIGGSACEFGGVTGAGHSFPTSACTPKGDSFVSVASVLMNSDCLTDSQLQGEVATMVAQTGIVRRTTPGYTPMVTLLLPPGVETCLDAARTLCSVNAYLNPPPAKVSTSNSGGHILTGTYRVSLTYTTASGESVPSSMQLIATTTDVSTLTIKSPPPSPVPGVTGWNAYVTTDKGATLLLQSGSIPIGTDVTLDHLTGGAAPTQPGFCSYHSQVNVGGTLVDYIVQPWSAGTGCDEPDAPSIPDSPTPQQLSVAVGQRLVSPISQSHIAAIVNPAFNGWVAQDGSEIDDGSMIDPIDGTKTIHVCAPVPGGLDTVTLGSSSQNPYFVQREFNNAAVLELDPWTYFGCAPAVNLAANFVSPSAVNQGDEVQFDGSSTISTLIVPSQRFFWNFGDGSASATGPSVVHTFAKAGTYTVTLTVVDRGGNPSSISHVVTVLTTSGQPAPPPTSGGGSGAKPLSVHLQLLPESLRSALTWGLRLRVRSNQRANGMVTVSISRQTAKRAHIRVGRSLTVVIGRGTVSQISNGTITLRLRLSHKMALRLHSLRHVTVTVKLALVPAVGRRLTILIAGRY
jgi:hypothetical protein